MLKYGPNKNQRLAVAVMSVKREKQFQLFIYLDTFFPPLKHRSPTGAPMKMKRTLVLYVSSLLLLLMDGLTLAEALGVIRADQYAVSSRVLEPTAES